MPTINWSQATTVAVGVALFGAAIYAMKQLPSNSLTDTATNVATGGN